MAKIINKEITTLMELLDEQDEPLFAKISESIQSYGLSAIPYLEVTSEKSLDDKIHSRIRKLISKIRVQNLYRELHNWAILEADDLLKGYFIISKYLFPDLDENLVMAKVEALKKEVWLELNKEMTPFEELKVISKVFYVVRKFSFNMNGGALPDSLCLNAVLNTGKGFPLALSVLYTGIAQRLGISVYSSKTPEAMFLTYVYSNKKKKPDLDNGVMFYLNPFAVGVFFSNQEVEAGLAKEHPDNFKEYTGACNNIGYIVKILENMAKYFVGPQANDKKNDILLLMRALKVE